MLKVKNILKRSESPKKDVRKENRDAKEFSDKNRKGAEELVTHLETINFSVASESIPEEKMRIFRGYTAILIRRIKDSAVVCTFDAKEQDEAIKNCIRMYQKALKDGDTDTIVRAIKAIQYGIEKARVDVDETEMNHLESILQKRNEKLKAHVAAVNLSEKIFDINKNLIQKDKEIEDATKDYKEQYDKVDLQIKARPDLYEHLKTYRPGIDSLMPEAKEIDTQMSKLKSDKVRISNLRHMRSTYDTQRNEFITKLKALEDQLSLKDIRIDEQTLDALQVMNERVSESLSTIETEVRKMEEMGDQYFNSINAIYDSTQMGGQVIKHLEEFEEIVRTEKERNEGIAKGQQNLENLKNNSNEKQLNTL